MMAFSEHGYEATSVRLLNRDLGLSHGTISQRFGPKEKLFFAAINWSFAQLTDELMTDPPDETIDDLELLHQLIKRLLLVANQHTHLVRFIQKEATSKNQPFHRGTRYLDTPYLSKIYDCIQRLAAAGRIKPVNPRWINMLIVFGGTAPAAMPSLNAGPEHLDPIDSELLAATMTDIIVSGLKL